MTKILLIESDNDLRVLLKRFFAGHGFEAKDFCGEEPALQSLQQECYDIVLCEYWLQGINAITLIHQIQTIQRIPVIVFTGYADVKTAVDTMKAGAFYYLLKPQHPAELLKIVQSALHQKEPNQPAIKIQAERKCGL